MKEFISHCIENITVRDIFVENGKRLELSPNEVVFEIGGYPDGVYYIEEGEVDVFVSHDRSVKSCAGNIVGEMAFFSPGAVRTATVIATTHTVLYYLAKERYDDIVPPTIASDIMELAAKRKAEWPITQCPYSQAGVRLINIYPNYMELLKHILSKREVIDEILQRCGIDTYNNTIEIYEAQFGGQGSIKHVIRLGLTVGDLPISIGLRFIGKSCFKDMASASLASKDEVEMFKLLNAVKGDAIQMWHYFDIDDLARIDETCFMHCMDASVAGIMVGDYIPVMRFCEKTSVTGVSISDLEHIVATLIKTWFLSFVNQTIYPDKGLGMMDLKLENFVYNPKDDSFPIIDMGGMTWISLISYIYEIYDFIRLIEYLEEPDIMSILQQGCAAGFNSFIRNCLASKDMSTSPLDPVIEQQINTLKDIYPDIREMMLQQITNTAN